MSISNKGLFHAIMGHHESALEELDANDNKFENSMIRAQLKVLQGKAGDAIQILDQAKQDTPYQKWHVYQIMTSAFLQNCEPKSA